MEGVKNRVKGCLSCVVPGKRGAIGMKFRILCVSGLRKMGLLRQRLGFLCSSAGKESACNAGDPGSIPGLGSSPEEGIGYPLKYSWASLVAQTVTNLQFRRHGFDPWVGKISWRRAWQPTPVFLPGESPWTEESDGLQSMGS